ncbi:MAG TPA: hypothetical protein VGN57_18175 [Pirellulaceae bacterium]|jgi:hypothetical protein|nr:hypothetical protein [Pirellulaceae bacterium]
MKRLRYFASPLLLVVACTRTEVPPPAATSGSTPTKSDPISQLSEEEVQRDVRIRTEATFAGDVETMLDYISASKMAEDGGRDASRRNLQTALGKMREAGGTLESLTFHAPPEFVTTSERTYAIVPLTAVISAQGGARRMRSVDYHIGVREKSSNRFLDYRVGSQFSLDELRERYPDFPAVYEFPEASSVRLEPKKSIGSDSTRVDYSATSGSLTAGRTRESTIAEVQADVRRRIEASHAGDVDTLMRTTSKSLKQKTGEEDARRITLERTEMIRGLNLEIESIEFPEPPKFAQAPDRLFVLVPSATVVKSRNDGRRVRMDECSTAVLKRGASGFEYVDGGLPLEQLRELYPDLPDNYRYSSMGITPLSE